MEDILKFLLVAGILIIGFVRQAKKESPNTIPSKDDDNMPFPHKNHPLPENWEDIPIPSPQQTDNTQTEKHVHKQKAKPFIPQNYQTQQTALHSQPAVQTPQNSRSESEDTSTTIDILSTEEIRKGIIWSEILQRKY